MAVAPALFRSFRVKTWRPGLMSANRQLILILPSPSGTIRFMNPWIIFPSGNARDADEMSPAETFSPVAEGFITAESVNDEAHMSPWANEGLSMYSASISGAEVSVPGG